MGKDIDNWNGTLDEMIYWLNDNLLEGNKDLTIEEKRQRPFGRYGRLKGIDCGSTISKERFKKVKKSKPDSIQMIGNNTIIIEDFNDFRNWMMYFRTFISRISDIKPIIPESDLEVSHLSLFDLSPHYNISGKLNIFIPISPIQIIQDADNDEYNMVHIIDILNTALAGVSGDIHVIFLYTGYWSEDELIKISEMGFVRTINRAKAKLRHLLNVNAHYNYKVHIDGTRYGINFNINNNKFVKKYYYLKLLPWYTKVDLPKKSHGSVKERFEQEKKKSTILTNYYKHNSLGEDSDESLK